MLLCHAGDGGKVSFLRIQLEQLYKREVALQEEKNILLRAQQEGGHCLYCHHLLTIGSILLLESWSQIKMHGVWHSLASPDLF